MWAKEISEGGHVGTTIPRAHPGGLPGAPPLVIFAPKSLKYSGTNHIKFSRHSENFYFWVIFYCTGNSENRQNMAFYFI